MSKDFHEQGFDDGTMLKLDVFRRYVREWIPVFLTDSPKSRHVSSINIFDLFSGPGEDVDGNSGSPVIIASELKQYCETRAALKAQKPIRMFFNDLDGQKITALRGKLDTVACKRGCCQIEFSARPFAEILAQVYPVIQDSGSANLVIMDQFGISEVTPEVVQRLAACSMTDVLFFIPSSYVYRFKDHPAFASKFDLSGRNLEYNTIHRFICEYYREKLGMMKYYLAPFSIKTGGNIHGVVFGSRHLFGLEKFLKVCWDIDPKTGEANYSVDQDPAWGGDQFLFEDMNAIRRIDLFEEELKAFIESRNPDNLAMYEYVLTKGFTPIKAGESLKKLQDAGWLLVESMTAGQIAKKGAFYLRHDEKTGKIRFQKAAGAS
jgi:three-Cys-motif partner protein